MFIGSTNSTLNDIIARSSTRLTIPCFTVSFCVSVASSGNMIAENTVPNLGSGLSSPPHYLTFVIKVGKFLLIIAE